MAINLTGTFAGASALMLAAVSASADGRIDPRACKRDHLSEETRAFCEVWQQMDARARFKFRVQERLRRTNQPPVAILEPVEAVAGFAVGPRLVELDGSRSFDPDGFVAFYTFQLFDGDTDEILSTAVTTRDPGATLRANRDLPPNLRATLIVEDDERATDTDELSLTGSGITCSNLFFSCTTSSGQTGCTVTSAVSVFTTDDLLDAAQRCDPDITESTMLVIGAWGGNGGKGADCAASGGAGGMRGIAAMGTTLADLDSIYGGPGETTYCLGIGEAGSHGDTDSGAGGASTILRTCQNVSQTETTGVLLVAGGGGGGEAAQCIGGGHAGFEGGLAFSTTSDACPPSCVSGSTFNGGAGGEGGSGGIGGDGGGSGNDGHNGIGGHGGPASDTGTPTWSHGSPGVTGDTGAGASGSGGTGGGGYGGGAAPGEGGGGGGSYAARSTQSINAIVGSGPGAGFLFFNFKP